MGVGRVTYFFMDNVVNCPIMQMVPKAGRGFKGRSQERKLDKMLRDLKSKKKGLAKW
jgi:hypothetical protein